MIARLRMGAANSTINYMFYNVKYVAAVKLIPVSAHYIYGR